MLVGEADSTAAVPLAVLHFKKETVVRRERDTADFIALHSVDVIHMLVF